MYSLIFLCLTAAASAVPHYLITEPSPAFSLVRVVDKKPPRRVVSHESTYYNPVQNLKRVVLPARINNAPAPVTTSAPARVATPYRTESAPITSAQVGTGSPSRTYNVPTQAPVRVAAPVRTYNAATTTAAPVRVAAPVRTYNSPNTAPVHDDASLHTNNVPAPAATYISPSVHIGAPVAAIVRDKRVMPDGGAGEYNFEFETADGITRSEQGEVTDSGMKQKGGWSFTLPDGTHAVFTFVADKNGFQVQSDLLPVPPPMPAHALAQIERARLENEAQARTTDIGTHAAPRNTYSATQEK